MTDKYNYHLYYERWLKRYNSRFSGIGKFRQDGSYLKKEPNHNKNDWREKKGFAKDQAKLGGSFCNCGRFLKQYGSRKQRRWERKMIHVEKYDSLYYHQDMFVSSWDAC